MSVHVHLYNENECVFLDFYILSCQSIVCFLYLILQAAGDGGQGWSNAVVYIFLSPTIRKQLFIYPLIRIMLYFSKKRGQSCSLDNDQPRTLPMLKENLGLPWDQRIVRVNTGGFVGSSDHESDEEIEGRAKDSGVVAEMSSPTT